MATIKRPIGFVSGTATAQTATSEITISELPDRIALVRVMVRLVSGSGTGCWPSLGTATAPGGAGLSGRIYSGSASVAITLKDDTFVPAVLTDGKLYLRPGCDTGSDNVVDWLIAYEVI